MIKERIPITLASDNPTREQVQRVMQLYTAGDFEQALVLISQLLQDFPNSSFLYNILAASHAGAGQYDAAITGYTQALRIQPNDAKTHFNLGIALAEDGDLDAAIASYQQALNIEPDYAPAYNNMGNTLKDNGDLTRAIESYRGALKVDPDYAEVYINLGNALKDTGALDQAIGSYKQALNIIPDYAEAFNNMGSALKDKGEVEQARSCYDNALRISPSYVDAAWNRVGTVENIEDADRCLKQCLLVDQDHVTAKILLCVLNYFRGERIGFDELMKSPLKDHPMLRSMKWVSEFSVLPHLHFTRWSFFDQVVELSAQGRPFYEFGVFTGESFRYLIGAFDKGYGFDTFEGLPEDWRGEKAGSYSSGGAIPDIAGGEFIAGKFEDTLPGFFSEPRPVASVINYDADLYSSTLCALNHSRPVIDAQTILIFDEFIVNESWEQDEYKALNEFCAANNFSYEVLAISFVTKQVAIKLMGI